LIALGGFLRLYGLESQSLWQDEGLQHYVATQNSIGELFSKDFVPSAAVIHH